MWEFEFWYRFAVSKRTRHSSELSVERFYRRKLKYAEDKEEVYVTLDLWLLGKRY
jgi:hypothetical protein